MQVAEIETATNVWEALILQQTTPTKWQYFYTRHYTPFKKLYHLKWSNFVFYKKLTLIIKTKEKNML